MLGCIGAPLEFIPLLLVLLDLLLDLLVLLVLDFVDRVLDRLHVGLLLLGVSFLDLVHELLDGDIRLEDRLWKSLPKLLDLYSIRELLRG